MDKPKSLWVCVALAVVMAIVGSVFLFGDRDGNWKRLEYGELSFKVPDSWEVIEKATVNGECLGGQGKSIVALEGIPSKEEVHLCPTGSVDGISHLTLSVRPHEMALAGTQTAIRIGKLDGVIFGDYGTDTRIHNVLVIPQLKVEFEFDGDRKFEGTRRKILDSVRLKE